MEMQYKFNKRSFFLLKSIFFTIKCKNVRNENRQKKDNGSDEGVL